MNNEDLQAIALQASLGVGTYIVNDYLITVAQSEDGNGYTLTIRKGAEVQTIHLTELTQEYVDNCIQTALAEAKASGEFDGNGIERIVFNDDYTLTIYFTQTEPYTIGNIRGATGNGIQNIVLNDDYTLTINYTDGNSVTTDPIRGATGNGISGISFDSQNYTLTINFTDGESFTTGSIRGATGNGIASVRLNADYTLTITYTDGNSVTTSSIRGAKGDTGITPDISIGTVSTLAPNEPATAEITGTPEEPVLSLGIPKGNTGATPAFSIGTVTTLDPSEDATATISGTPEAPVLSLGIPQGIKGDTGEISEEEFEAGLNGVAIHSEAEAGNIVTITDGADGMPVKKLTVGIEPVQEGSGDPSPENIRPITGYTGAEIVRTGKSFYEPLDYEPYVNGTAQQYWGTNIGVIRNAINKLPKGRQYSIIFDFKVNSVDTSATSIEYGMQLAGTGYSGGRTRIAYSDRTVNQVIHTKCSFFLNENANITQAYFYASRDSVILQNFMIIEGNTDSTYEPYTGTTIPITFPTEAGTVYGGYVTIEDGEAVLTVTHRYEQLARSSWSLSGQNFWHLASAMSNTNPAKLGWCTHYKSTERLSGDNTITFGYNSFSSAPRIVIRDSRFTTADDFMTYLNEQYENETPVKVAYPLATPLTYNPGPIENLTTLLGLNNIWANTGDITEFEYSSDPKTYIDDNISSTKQSVEEMISARTDGMTAPKNLTTGELIVADGVLYKATTNITSGTTLTPGTNVAVTTLEAEIASVQSDVDELVDSTLAVTGKAADAKATGDIIASGFDASTAYTVGSYVLKNGVLYRFTAAHSGAWTGTDAETVTVGGEIEDVKDTVDNLDTIIYPNSEALVKQTLSTLPNVNDFWNLSTLKKGNTYRIVLSFSDIPIRLSNLKTSTAASGSGVVDTITSLFVGDNWVGGKTAIYTPQVDNIKYLQIQMNSAYTGGLSATLKVYDYTAEQKTAITQLDEKIAEKQKEIDSLKYIINLEQKYNLLPPSGYEVGKYISTDGTIRTDNVSVLSDYIEIDPSKEYICNYTKTASVVYGNSNLTGNVNTFDRLHFCFFDENKNVVPFSDSTSTTSKAIPETAKYIRVTLLNETVYPLAVLIYGNYSSQPIVRPVEYKKIQQNKHDSPNTGFENFKMVMFGDSITHGSLSAGDKGISYVDYANDYLHSNIINVGFGGTRMTYPTIEGTSLFCFRNLVDCIVSDDATAWDTLDAYASSDNTSYLPHLNKLKAVEWDKIHAIGLMYGANDFTSNTPVGSAYNEDVLNFDGACASALKKLLTKYPHLQVIIFAPFDRMMNISDPTTMTDTTPNNGGLYMSDYANSLENVVSKFHCPLIKTGELFGINAQTILTYAPDGTHPRSNVAQRRLGWLFAQAVKNNLAPFN